MKKYLSLGTESRKSAIFMVLWVSATALLCYGKVSSPEWIELSKWGFGFLAAGLTAEHFSDKTQA